MNKKFMCVYRIGLFLNKIYNKEKYRTIVLLKQKIMDIYRKKND